jgi:hypothetical protein
MSPAEPFDEGYRASLLLERRQLPTRNHHRERNSQHKNEQRA